MSEIDIKATVGAATQQWVDEIGARIDELIGPRASAPGAAPALSLEEAIAQAPIRPKNVPPQMRLRVIGRTIIGGKVEDSI